MQLVRRLGESGTLQIGVRDEGASAERQLQVKLDSWLKGADEPDPIQSPGLRPWRPAITPVLAEIDPKGPAAAAGLKTGDKLLALDDVAVTEWQQVVDRVRARPDAKVVVRVERDGAALELPVTLARKGDCLLYTSPSPRDRQKSRMPSSA